MARKRKPGGTQSLVSSEEEPAIDVGNAPELERTFPGQDFLSAWATPEAFGRYIEGLEEKKAWHDGGWEKGSHRDRFTGTKDMATAIHLSQGNWKEGTQLIEKVGKLVRARYPLRKQPVQYDVVGAYPNVPRAVAGNLLNMVKVDPAKSRRRQTITLISDMSANCGVDAKSFVHRASVVAAMVDEIENKGFACEIIAIANTEGSGKYKATTAVRVKESHQPLDLPRIAFALGHPSMFRRFIFADWGSHKKNQGTLSYGLGHCQEYKIPETDEGKNIYIIPSCEGKYEGFFETETTTVNHGLAFLIESLQRQGCPAFPKKFNFRYFDEKGNVKIPDDVADEIYDKEDYDDEDDDF